MRGGIGVPVGYCDQESLNAYCALLIRDEHLGDGRRDHRGAPSQTSQSNHLQVLVGGCLALSFLPSSAVKEDTVL